MSEQQKVSIEIPEEEITRQAAAIWGRKGGKSRSESKARAVRENGKLGGRPKRKRSRKQSR